MAFTARIEVIGLFRFCPTPNGEPPRIYGLAPWTGLGARRDLAAAKPDPLHHLVAMWWPRSQTVGLPTSAMTLWPLGGMELTFDFETRDHSPLEANLESLRLPFMIRESSSERAPRAIVPASYAEIAKVKDDFLTKQAGDFEADFSDAGRYTEHLGIRKNREGLMGRVVIDRGEVHTDDLTSQASVLRPSLWNEGEYSGYFTNRIDVVVRRARAVVMQARNLVTGKLAGEVRLTTGDRELLIQVLHLCPEQLLSDCPERPTGKSDRPDDPGRPILVTDRDEDFHRLYDLSSEPLELKKEMWARGEESERACTVPVGYFDGHSCRLTRCGSCVG